MPRDVKLTSADDTFCLAPHQNQHARCSIISDLKEYDERKRTRVSKLRTVQYSICLSPRCLVHGFHKTFNLHVRSLFSSIWSKQHRYLSPVTSSSRSLCPRGRTWWFLQPCGESVGAMWCTTTQVPPIFTKRSKERCVGKPFASSITLYVAGMAEEQCFGRAPVV